MVRNGITARFQAAIEAVGRTVAGLWPRWNGWGYGRPRLLLPSARFDWEFEAGDPWRNSTVALGIAWLGDRFPRPKVHLSKLSRTGDYVPLARHPVVDLWQRPNPYYSRRTMEKAIGLSLKTDGNAYIYKLRDKGGRVVQLWWLPHFRTQPTWPADGSVYIDGYRVRVDGDNWYLIPPTEIIHIRDGIDPWNERLGLAALKATLREVVTLNLGSGYTAALLKNSGVPGIAIVPDGPNPPRPDEDAAKRMKQQFVEKFSGDMAGQPIVLAGSYKIVPVGFSPENMALSVLTRDAEARVAASIGVAAMSLGLPDPNKTYSNLAEANRASWGTIVSVQELIAEALRFDLLMDTVSAPSGTSTPLDPLAYAFDYDYSEIQELQESLDAIHARTRDDFRFDIIRKNEAREQLGLEPEPGETGDLFFSDIQTALAKAKSAGAVRGGDEPTSDDPTSRESRLSQSANGNGNAKRWDY